MKTCGKLLSIPAFALRSLVFTLSVLIIFPVCLRAQNNPEFRNYTIAKGYSVYLPAKPDSTFISYAPDSSKSYRIEVTDTVERQLYHFGEIVIESKNHINIDPDTAIARCLDSLKRVFHIQYASSYVFKDYRRRTHPGPQGAIDCWTDEKNMQWNVAVWIKDDRIIFQYIFGHKYYPNDGAELFFESATFPGDK